MSINQCVATPEKGAVMPEPTLPLPTDHVFVLQLQESHGRPATCRAGRVEHLTSGEATRFATTEELWDFVGKVLTGQEFREDRS